MTLNGFIEGPDGEIDWLVRDPSVDFGDILNEIISDKDAIFYGRISYEKWGNVTPENASPKVESAYKRTHAIQKYVFSKSQTGDDTKAVFINSGIEEKVLELKAQPGKNIWLYGGADIAATFLGLGLIDEFRLAVHPVVIGKGKALFENIEGYHQLKLIGVETYDSGVILLRYNAGP